MISEFIFRMWFPILLSGSLATFLMVYLNPIARQIGLVDQPDNRKRHDNPVPLIGGIAIITAVLITLPLLPMNLNRMRLFIFSIGILAIVGVVDDHQNLSAGIKFLFQLLVASLLVFADDLVVSSIGDIFSWNDGNEQGLGVFEKPLSILAIIGVINAFNMIDGHDGLAGSLFLTSAISILIVAVLHGNWDYVYLLSIFLVVIGVFLFFNLSLFMEEKRKVFLGDTGSMCLGLTIVYLLIDTTQLEVPVIRTATAVWMIAIPLLDLLSVVIIRMCSGLSPMRPDRKHIHHNLLSMGLKKNYVLFTLITAQVLFCLVGVIANLTSKIPDWLLFWGMFPIFLGYFWLVYALRTRYE